MRVDSKSLRGIPRPTHYVEYEGKRMTLRALALRVGVPHGTITRRFREGKRLPELIAPPDPRKQRRGSWGDSCSFTA